MEKKIGFGLKFSYFDSDTSTFIHSFNTPFDDRYYKTKIYSNFLNFIPFIKINLFENNNININFKFGTTISSGKVYVENLILFDYITQPFYVKIDEQFYKYKLINKYSFGIFNEIDIEKKITKYLKLSLNISYTNLSFHPTEANLIIFNMNNVNSLTTIEDQYKKLVFSKDNFTLTTLSNTIFYKPNYSFNNINFSLGFKFVFNK